MDYEAELEKKIKSMSNHSIRAVFEDFVSIMAIIGQKASVLYFFDEAEANKLEQEYLNIARKYSKEELVIIAEMYALFLSAVQQNYDKGVYRDVLGSIYERMGFCDGRYKSQFFTPEHIAVLMAKMTLGDVILPDDKEFISINDCCCGGGRNLLKAAECIREKGIDVSRRVLFVGMDIDPIMAKITFVQLNHYACPAVIQCGDALMNTVNTSWITISCAMQWYKFKKVFEKSAKDVDHTSNMQKSPKLSIEKNPAREKPREQQESGVLQYTLF